MKPTQRTEILANIKKTFVSFFSILMFVALGVGIFLGISWAGPALENAADKTFNDGNFHGFQIQFPYGLSDSDLKELSQVEGVSQVEAARQSFQTIVQDGKDVTVKVQSIGTEIDVLSVLEGALPTKSNEIAFNAEAAKEHNVNVGDTITFEKDSDSSSTMDVDISESATTSEDDDGSKYLNGREFKVTAIVNSPDYISLEKNTYGISTTPSGVVDMLAWVVPDVFDASAFQDGYPVVNVRSDSLNGMSTHSPEYKDESKVIQGRLDELGEKLALARYDDLHGQAQKRIDDAQKQLDDAKQQIADGEQQLEDGRAELEAKKAEGQAKLNDAYQTLMEGEAAKAEGEARLSEARAKVNEGQRKIDEADAAIAEANAEVTDAENYKKQCDADLAAGKITQEEYNKRLDERGAQARAELQPIAAELGYDVPEINHRNYDVALAIAREALNHTEEIPVEVEGEEMTLGEARVKLANAKKQLADAEAEYDEKVAELNDGWSQYYAGWAEYDALVAEGEQRLADGEKQIEEGRQKVAENEPKLESAQAQLDAMAQYEWTVLPRSYNSGAASISVFSGVTNNLSISMAALFIIVGLLVSYFAVSRIVREQITQIGTKKALGFRQGEITKSYLWYSGIAVIAGSIIGTIVGFLLVEGIIGSVLGGMYTFGTYPGYFGIWLFLIVTALELVLVLGATYLACRGILKEHAVELLKGPKPPTGKTHFYEKWGIWDKLPLLIQTIVNNCVNDKRRVLSTIVGVAGATALIVTAITLNNDVLKSYDKQYSDVYNFNAIAFADYEPDNAIENLEKALVDKGSTTAQVSSRTYTFEEPNDGGMSTVQFIVPVNEDAFFKLYHIRPVSGEEVDLSQDGAYVTQAYGQHLGAKVGDDIELYERDGSVHKVKILGFYDFYLTYHEMVMGRDFYEREFGKLEPNVVLADTGDVAVEDLEKDLSKVDGFYSIVDDKSKQYKNFATFSKVSSAVVAIYLALAALMAVVVLLNLNVMFIDEKKRELIVLMINGFSVKDAKHYISYDNIVLTALGIIVGLILGCVMGSITVAAIEPSTAVFVKDVDLWAVLIGIAGSAILALIMSIIALRRIPKFELTDINKF